MTDNRQSSASDNLIELKIDAAILSGEFYAEARIDHSGDWRRQYEIWTHADRILSSASPSEHDLACVLFQLNRAVDFRDKILDEVYAFRKIPIRLTSNNKHEIMENLGIIKTQLKIKLDLMRNRLMHLRTEPPPPLAVCKELSEFTWYYLKTTDRLAQQSVCDLGFSYWSDPQSLSTLTVFFKAGSWDLCVVGKVRPALLREASSSDCMVVKVPASAVREGREQVQFSGQVVGTAESLVRLVRLFLEESSVG